MTTTSDERIVALENAIVGLVAQNETLGAQVTNLNGAVFALKNQIAELNRRPIKYEFSAPTYVVEDKSRRS